MRTLFGCLAVTFALLGGMAVSTVSLAASKPSGGYCECGQYIEVPVLCQTKTGSELEICRKSNTQWFGECTAWLDQECHAPASSHAQISSPAEASPSAEASPQTERTSSIWDSLLPSLSSSPSQAQSAPPQFVGTWSGQQKCWSDTAPMKMIVTRNPGGSIEARTFIRGVAFSLQNFKGDSVTLLYSSALKDTIYSGRLVSPNRIEGTVSINKYCSWYLEK